MTVCIAAYSSGLKRFFAVADTKLSGDSLALESATQKVRVLTDDARWHCMFSTADLAEFENVYERITARLVRTGAQSTDVRTAVRDSYAEVRAEIAQARGAESLLEHEFTLELLILGFDRASRPHLVHVLRTGEWRPQTMLGFAAIGSGAWAAVTTLHLNPDFRHSADVGVILFRLCEAKFAAELLAAGVGTEHTTVLTMNADGIRTAARPSAVDHARKIWEKRRTAPAPPAAVTRLRAGFAFDSSGMYVPDAVEERRASLITKFEETRRRLDACVAAGKLGQGAASQVRNVTDDVSRYNEQAIGMLGEWGVTYVEPDEMKTTMTALEHVVSSAERLLADFSRRVAESRHP